MADINDPNRRWERARPLDLKEGDVIQWHSQRRGWREGTVTKPSTLVEVSKNAPADHYDRKFPVSVHVDNADNGHGYQRCTNDWIVLREVHS